MATLVKIGTPFCQNQQLRRNQQILRNQLLLQNQQILHSLLLGKQIIVIQIIEMNGAHAAHIDQKSGALQTEGLVIIGYQIGALTLVMLRNAHNVDAEARTTSTSNCLMLCPFKYIDSI